MRWLMIVLLVSLGALLLAAAGVARHIWLQRTKPRDERSAALEPAEESDLEVKP
jgi:sialic acid synthase SpsE